MSQRAGGNDDRGNQAGPDRELVDSLRREVASLRQERDTLASRLDSIAEVIGSADTSRIVHDVRNVMNEVVLLRKLAELEE